MELKSISHHVMYIVLDGLARFAAPDGYQSFYVLFLAACLCGFSRFIM
jgi:hypothetical protein